MLDNLRKQGASLFIWVIFAILISVFVINFGPQSPGSGQGCTGAGRRTMLTVGDSEVDEDGFRFAINNIPGEDDSQRAALAYESLIVRELLAQEGERRGLRIPDDYINHSIVDGKLHFQGALLLPDQEEAARDMAAGKPPLRSYIDYRGVFYNEDGVFDYERFERWTRARGMTVAKLKRQQAREILASTVATILMESVPASREEARLQFINENTRVSFEAVRFDPRRYQAALLITDEDIDRWAAAHEAEVKATYSPEVFKGKKQVHVRRIAVPRSPGLDKPADPAAPAPADPARAKLEALRASILAGKSTFAAAAKANDREPTVAARGGALGWFDEGAPSLPDQKLNDALATLEQGKVSEVIATDDAFYLLTIDDRREGDLTFEQVKRELAEPLARDAWGKEAAKRAAIAAIAIVKAGVGKNLKELFPTDKMGALPVESEDFPVAWLQDEPAPPAAGAPDPAAAPAAPKAESLMIPSDEKLPALAPIESPGLESFGPVQRAGNRTPLGESPALARALFEQLTTGAIGQEIYEVRPSVMSPPQYVIVQVTDKQLADITQFEKDAERYVARLARTRGAIYLVDWLRDRCNALVAKKAIGFQRDVVQPLDEKGNRLPVTYAPCMAFNFM